MNKKSNYNKIQEISDLIFDWDKLLPNNDDVDKEILDKIYELVDKYRGEK